MHEPTMPTTLDSLTEYDRLELIAFASKTESEGFHYAYENWPPAFETELMQQLATDRFQLEALLDVCDPEISTWWDTTDNPGAELDAHDDQARQRAEAHLLWAVRPDQDDFARAYLQAFATLSEARQWLADRAELQKQNPAAWGSAGWQLLHREHAGDPWQPYTAPPGPEAGHGFAEAARAHGWEVTTELADSGVMFTVHAAKTLPAPAGHTVANVTWTTLDAGATWDLQTVYVDPGVQAGGRGPRRKRPSLHDLIAVLALGEPPAPARLTCVDLDAGPGTRALGLEAAGFTVLTATVEHPDDDAVIADNRPGWGRVTARLDEAVRQLPELGEDRISLLSARLPTPDPAGDSNTDRTAAVLDPIVRAATVLNPEAILLEGVRAWITSDAATFAAPRARLLVQLAGLGYKVIWRELDGADHATPTSYSRAVAVALQPGATFTWPEPDRPVTAGEALHPTWADRGLDAKVADTIAARADHPGPRIMVTSADLWELSSLVPARAAGQWTRAGLDYSGIDPDGTPATPTGPKGRGPRLTPSQLAVLKGIPADWTLSDDHRTRLDQIGRAFPPPFATALGRALAQALNQSC